MSAVIDLVVPDIGDFHDVPVIEVLVKPGDRIDKDAPLVTLESEKATMEVPASSGGTVHDIAVNVGDKVSAGSIIAHVTGSESQAEGKASTAPAATTPREPEPPPASKAATSTAAPPATVAPSPPPSRDGEGQPATPSRTVHGSPAIRRFARELGVDLGAVSGSGPNGRITRNDVQRFVKGVLAAPGGVAAASSLPGLPAWPKLDFEQFGQTERVRLSRIKRIAGPNLHRNWVMIPHVTQHDDADITELEAFRQHINAEQRDVKVTLLAFLMKAAVAALRHYPQFNASLDGDELILKQYYHLGFAADTPEGLVVPVIRDVDRKGIFEIARETAELANRARDGKLGLADMQGGTFTISSLGGIGGTYFSPIINAPEVAILGVCRAATRPVWEGTAFVPRLLLPLSLSYDHRVVDGAAAARFTVFLAGVLADMRRTLL